MIGTVYRFTFEQSVDLAEAEATLHLALYASEGLLGAARVRLEFGYQVEGPGRAIVVDATNRVGSIVARIFTALLLREFGEEAVFVRAAQPQPPAEAEDQAA